MADFTITLNMCNKSIELPANIVLSMKIFMDVLGHKLVENLLVWPENFYSYGL